MKLYIKNMVSLRCKLLVSRELTNIGADIVSVELGMAEIHDDLSNDQQTTLRSKLQQWGLDLIHDRKAILIERIKGAIVELVHNSTEAPKVNNSTFLAEKLDYDYTYLSNVFSNQTGQTITQFIIRHKIERVKQLLLYGELSLTQIAHKLHYSSVAHLANQFKKITGMTPMQFKRSHAAHTKNLEDI